VTTPDDRRVVVELTFRTDTPASVVGLLVAQVVAAGVAYPLDGVTWDAYDIDTLGPVGPADPGEDAVSG
jgi:hypothetical protein